MTPFRSMAYRQLWASSVASTAAQGMERTATAWLALEAGGALAIGLSFAARTVPSLLFGLAAGTIADRTHRPRQLLLVAGSAFLLMAGFGFLAGGGEIQTWQVVALAFFAGCIQVFDTPARQALVLDTVPREEARRALALTALGARGAFALGAFAAGALIPRFGVTYTYSMIALVYLVMGALAATLRVTQLRRGAEGMPSFRQAFRQAFRLVIDTPAMRTLVLAGIACEVFAFSHQSALPLFAEDVLATGAGGLGVLNATAAIGAAVAVAFLSFAPGRVRGQPMLAAVFLIYGLSLIALSFSNTLAMAATVLLITGFCAGTFDVLQQTLIQLAAPEEQRGRAVGVWVFSLGSAPLGHLEVGLLAGAFGAPVTLVINGLLTVASAGTLLARAPSFRWTRWASE
jgi:MFS family permease